MTHLAKDDPARYAAYGLGVPYADGTRQACDVCLGSPTPWEWAIEVKMLRFILQRHFVIMRVSAVDVTRPPLDDPKVCGQQKIVRWPLASA